jgi:exosortase
MTAIRAFVRPARAERTRTVIVRRAAPAAVLAACAMALLPWIWSQAQVLWAQPHYGFIPLVPLGAAALIVRDCRRLGALRPGSRRASLALLAASGAALATADLFLSSMCGTVAALAALLAVAHGLGGAPLVRAALPGWAFLALAVRPPLYLDDALIVWLQDLATRGSSPVLDLLGIVHVATGHVIETPGGRLLIEGACSGAHSLFVTVAAVLFAALWWRMSWPRALVLLASAVGWVLMGNVVRIVAVAYLAGRWGVDVGSGWRHEALGFVILMAALGLLASTDRLSLRAFGALRWGLSRWRDWRSARALRPVLASLAFRGAHPDEVQAVVAAMRAVPDPPSPPRPDDATPTLLPDWRATWLGSWWAAAAIGLVGLVQVAVVGRGLVYAAPQVGRSLAALSADVLPESWGPFRRESFDVSREGARSLRGEEARCWTYRSERATAVVSVHHPYLGWHELTDCYRAQGWRVDARRVEPGGDGSCVSARLSSPPERYAALWFSFFDGGHRPVSPPGGGRLAYLRERMDLALGRASSGWRGRGGGATVPSYLIQLLVKADDPLSPADEAEARAFFDRAGAALRRRASGGQGDGPTD